MSEPSYTSVTIIGRNRLFRDGLKSLLEESEFRIVEEAEEVSQITTNADAGNHELILLDSGSRHGGLAADVDALVNTRADVPVVVLCDVLEHQALLDALGAGANGYLLKDISTEALVSSLKLVMLGEKVFPSLMSALLIKGVVRAPQTAGNNADLRELSHREVQILPYLVAGEPNKVIARRLRVTEATVKVHMKSLMRKIGTANRTQAAIWALNHGISGDPDEVVPDFDGADAPPPQWRDFGSVG